MPVLVAPRWNFNVIRSCQATEATALFRLTQRTQEDLLMSTYIHRIGQLERFLSSDFESNLMDPPVVARKAKYVNEQITLWF